VITHSMYGTSQCRAVGCGYGTFVQHHAEFAADVTEFLDRGAETTFRSEEKIGASQCQ
jgi:hypothetical protein